MQWLGSKAQDFSGFINWRLPPYTRIAINSKTYVMSVQDSKGSGQEKDTELAMYAMILRSERPTGTASVKYRQYHEM